LAFLPRGRSTNTIARMHFWPKLKNEPSLLGFSGYKVGMTGVFIVEDRVGSPDYGKETLHPATFIEAPPMYVCSIRAYIKVQQRLQTLSEVWMKDPPKDLYRHIKYPKNIDASRNLKIIEDNLARIKEFRVLTATQPRITGVKKKKPDVGEIKVDGGSIEEQFEYVKSIIGSKISVNDVFEEGQSVDVASITKGKGFQGPVKRWGVRILPRKSRKLKRGVAVIGPWHPARVLYTVPRPGQMGYWQRTEYNKRILKIDSDVDKINPKGGFLRYGPIRGTYILVDGSLPGPTKRLVRLRNTARPQKTTVKDPPRITYLSVESPQGK